MLHISYVTGQVVSYNFCQYFLTIKFYIIYERWVFCLQMLAVVTQFYTTSN